MPPPGFTDMRYGLTLEVSSAVPIPGTLGANKANQHIARMLYAHRLPGTNNSVGRTSTRSPLKTWSCYPTPVVTNLTRS